MAFPRIQMVPCSQNELNAMPTEKRLAAYYGVPKRLHHYTEADYLHEDQFRVYNFKQTKVAEDKTLTIPEQWQGAVELVNSDFRDKFVVINSYPYLFSTDRAGNSNDFYMHLLGCLAQRVAQRKTPINTDLSYLGTMTFPYEQTHAMKENQILSWGPVTDNMPDFKIQEIITGLYNFQGCSRIVILSVKDIKEALKRLHIDPKSLTHTFDISTADTVSPASSEESKVARRSSAVKSPDKIPATTRKKKKPTEVTL